MSPTNSTCHSVSQEPNISSVNQTIPHILWRPKVHHSLQQGPLHVPILSRLKPVHVNTRYSSQTHFIERVYAHVVTGHISFHTNTCHMHCPSHSSSCCSVPSCVTVSLETVASILVVLTAGNLLWILLLVTEGCVHGDRQTDRQTYSNPGHMKTSDSQLMNKEILYN